MEPTSGPQTDANHGATASRKRYSRTAGVLLALLVVGLYGWLSQPRGKNRTAAERTTAASEPSKAQGKRAPGPGAAPPRDFPYARGSDTARVYVVANLPFGDECVEKTDDCLLKLGEKYPDKLYIEFPRTMFDEPQHSTYRGPAPRAPLDSFETDEAHPKIFCAYILVNGKFKFSVPGEHGPKSVWLSGPEGELYTADDLQAIVEREIKKCYPAK